MENEEEYFCEHCLHDVTLTEGNTCPVCGTDLSQKIKNYSIKQIEKKLKKEKIVQFDHESGCAPHPDHSDVVIYDENEKAEISLRKVYEDVEQLKKEIEVLKEEK